MSYQDCELRYCFSTSSVSDTQAFGGVLAGLTTVGDVIILVGDLGAGKTAFVQGFSSALGVTTQVTSPTFTLANRYTGTLMVNHIDVYRFTHLGEANDLALSELFDDGVTLVEWGDKILSLLPEQYLTVKIRFLSDSDDSMVNSDVEDDIRLIELVARGETWSARSERLLAGLEPWMKTC